MKRIAIYTIIGCLAFLAAFVGSSRYAAGKSKRLPPPPPDAPDSVQLAAVGVHPGRQLVVYVFGGSRCGFCQKRETKAAFAELRKLFKKQYVASGDFASVHVVGVAVDTDLEAGLDYLRSVGNDAFDEISVGSGWQNEHIIQLIHREQIAEPAAPLVIAMSRSLTASLEPLSLSFGSDSVLKVVQGSDHISAWVSHGAALGVPADSPANQSRDSAGSRAAVP